MTQLYTLAQGWNLLQENGACCLYSTFRNWRISIDSTEFFDISKALEIAGKLGSFSPNCFVESLSEVLSNNTEVAANIFQRLKNHSVLLLCESKKSVADKKYSRQEAFWQLFANNEITALDMSGRLREARVFICGIGGMGCWLALLSAHIGVAVIRAFDYDIVEESNLLRQMLYSEKDVGIKKTVAAKNYFNQNSPKLKFEPVDLHFKESRDLEQLLLDIDLVFCPFGIPEENDFDNSVVREVLVACHDKKVPCLISGNSLLGPLITDNHIARFKKLYKTKNIFVNKIQASPGSTYQPAFTPRLAINAGLAVWEAARFLTCSTQCAIVNTAILIDTLNYTSPIFLEV